MARIAAKRRIGNVDGEPTWSSLKGGSRFEAGELAFTKFRTSRADRRTRQCDQIPVSVVRVLLRIPAGSRPGMYASWRLRKPRLRRDAPASAMATVQNGAFRLVRTNDGVKQGLACLPAYAMRSFDFFGVFGRALAETSAPDGASPWQRVDPDSETSQATP